MPKLETPPVSDNPKLFYAVQPDARQSRILVGRLTAPVQSDNFFPLVVANYRLGGNGLTVAGFQAVLFQILRAKKHWTYGAYSKIRRSTASSPFIAFTSVQGKVTAKALKKIREILINYPKNYSKKDLKMTKNMILSSRALKYDTPAKKLNILNKISTYKLPLDYIKQQKQIMKNISIGEIKDLINQYLNPKSMIYVVVGNKKQLKKVKQLNNFSDPIIVNK